MWKFLVKNQSIEILEREVLADHQISYVQFKFTFDGDWKRFHKVMQFSQCDEVYSVVLGTDGTSCYLPAELHAGAVKMSVFGYDTESDTTVRATTVPVTLNIRESGFEGEDPPVPPTADLYTQLLKRIEEASHGAGKSAYEIAVEHGYTGTEEQWLLSLHGADGRDGVDGANGRDGVNGKPGADGKDGKDGRDGTDGKDGKDGITPDLSAYVTSETLYEQVLLLREAIAPLEHVSHAHQNKAILDNTTASYTAEEKEKLAGLSPGNYATQDALNEQVLLLREALAPLEHVSHAHQNKDVLDRITSELLEELSGLQQFKESTQYDIRSLSESVNNFSNTAHTHENKDVLDTITAAKIAEWDSITTLKTKVNGLSTELTVFKGKCDNNAARVGAVETDMSNTQRTLESLQAQIDNLHPCDSSVTVFHSGSDTISTYGESIYTFYNDGYRSLAGFSESYPHFCCAENDYALYYNQADFNWGATIYTMCTEPVHLTSSKSILLSYKSGATDLGEMWLVPKSNESLSPSDTARYIHEKIRNNNAISVSFGWLNSVDNFISVLHSCGNIPAGEYHLAWKAVTDNTHPIIRKIKVLEVN